MPGVTSLQHRHHRADVGHLDRATGGFSRIDVLGSLGMRVADARGRLRHAANNRQLVGQRSGTSQQAGELQTRHTGGHRFKGALVFRHGLWLGIPAVDLRDSPLLKQHQDLLGPALPSRSRIGCRGRNRASTGQAQAQADKIATGNQRSAVHSGQDSSCLAGMSTESATSRPEPSRLTHAREKPPMTHSPFRRFHQFQDAVCGSSRPLPPVLSASSRVP